MIDKLTEFQESQLKVYRDKWLKIGLCTDRIDRKAAKEISDYYYKNLANKPTAPLVVLSSPLYAWVAVCLFKQVGSQVGSQVWSQVWSQVKKGEEGGD